MSVATPIDFETHGGWLVGRLNVDAMDDLSTLDEIETLGNRAIAEHKARFVALDLSRITYMITRGMTLMLSFHKRLREAGATLVLCGLDPNIARILRITRLDRVFEIYPTLETLLTERPEGPPGPSREPDFGP